MVVTKRATFKATMQATIEVLETFEPKEIVEITSKGTIARLLGPAGTLIICLRSFMMHNKEGE